MKKILRFFAAMVVMAVVGTAVDASAQYIYYGRVTSGGIGVPDVNITDPNGAKFVTDANGNWQRTLGPNYTNYAVFGIDKANLDFGLGVGVAVHIQNFYGTGQQQFPVFRALTYGQIGVSGSDTRFYTGISVSTVFPATGESYTDLVDSGGAFQVHGNTALPQVEYVNPAHPMTVTPSKYGLHFSPANLVTQPGAIYLSFSSAHTSLSLTTATTNINNASIRAVSITNFFKVAPGDANNLSILSVTSSSPLLPASNVVVRVDASGNGTVVLSPPPGVPLTSTISFTIKNDWTGDPTISNTFTLTVVDSAQAPVAGMPVAPVFNGTNTAISNALFGTYAPKGEVTVEFWQNGSPLNLGRVTAPFKAGNSATNQIVANVPYPANGSAPYGTIIWTVGNIGAASNSLSYILPTDLSSKWTHYAFVSSASNNVMQIYINGVLVATKNGASAFVQDGSSLIIGAPPFAGALSDFRIWNVARTSAQILQNFNNPLSPATPGLVDDFRFNDYLETSFLNSGTSLSKAVETGFGPYLGWMAAPTNFQYYTIGAFTTNNPLYLPGYIHNVAPSNVVWTIIDNSNLRGTLNQVSGGLWNYTPTTEGGDASFTYAVSSGPGTLTNTALVRLHVTTLSPPIISPIGNQLTEQNFSTQPIIFTVKDTNTPISQLNISVFGDNAALVDPVIGYNLILLTNVGDSNATFSLVMTPNPNAIGSANITVQANDTHTPVTQSFVLQVNQKPAYTIVDLGVLPGRGASFATAINNQGQITGYSTQNSSNQVNIQGFYYTGFSSTQQTIPFSSSGTSAAYAINDNGLITGFAPGSNGYSQAFVYDTQGAATVIPLGAVGTNSTSGNSTGFAINNNGTIAGISTTPTNGQFVSFLTSPLPKNAGIAGNSAALGLNNAGQYIGYVVTNGVTNSYIVTPVATNGAIASTNFGIGLQTNAYNLASAINRLGDVVGLTVTNNGLSHAWLRTTLNGTTDLGLPKNMLAASAYGLNAFDQVVGTATPGSGPSHAFLYSNGKMYDLNDLIPYEETNSWVLTDARGINDSGAIAGTGLINGQTHAFLALPAWVIGQAIPRPLGTVVQAPAFTVINGPTTAAAPFYYNVNDQQLYAIVPCTALIQWPTSILNPANPTNQTPPIVTYSKSVWPRQAQTHVASAPVQIVPQGLPNGAQFNYTFQSVMYSTSIGTQVDASSVFNTITNCYSVLRYIASIPGLPVDAINSPSIFQVVRSVAWNDPLYLSNNIPAVIGTPILNATHFDYAGRNGYVFFKKSPYDGLSTDPNRAYDLPTRTGPIIPVNTINTSLSVADQPLVVVWYHTNAIGVAWADTPNQYVPQWPVSVDPTNTIVIANQLGSGLLPATYLNPAPYVQNDPTVTGFNPNEEHAMMAGGVMYALRNDLNSLSGNLSQPYSLLKYQDASNSNQWAMRLFAVVATNASSSFNYSATAGTQIQPPLPLSVMQLCTSSNSAVSGPIYHAKTDGSLWAKAAGPNGKTTNAIIRYWYPLQPNFYYPNHNVAVGTCIPWLDAGTQKPVDVTYTISWPTIVNPMPIGQTLTSAANGLPDITDLLNAGIIFDSTNPNELATITNLARLYDPFTIRNLSVPAAATWPATMKFVNVNGLQEFADLPYYLRLRLIYDPISLTLGFRGLMADTTPGAAQLLLNNVMSIREREEIKSLDGGNVSGAPQSDFDRLIDQLYYLTRNPNRLTLSPPGTSATGFDTNSLLIGLTAKTNVVNEQAVVSIVPDTFGSNPKALTTGLFNGPPPIADPPGSTNYPPQYVTVVQDDPTTPGSVVQMFVIQISGGPALGNLAVLPGDNAFDQRLTLRHSGDFGGDPDPFHFQWFYFAGNNGGVSPVLPIVDANGNIINLNGWIQYQPADVATDTNGLGANDITLGEGGESGLLVMSDNWFVSRYSGYNVSGNTNWSGFIGQPGGSGAQFAPGWINRVLGGLNPFDARSSDFHTGPINTYQSMVEEAGARYSGPIALNADPTYINSIGLIEAYQTVLQTGQSLSVNGSPPVNYAPANAALMQVASKISDLYVLLGNEAYAEYADPTIGFNTGGSFGSLASSVFAFQDQTDSLLDQELALLRGRDDKTTTVRAAPIFNRLYWNFTGGNGEVAYVQTFSITDVNHDGFINAADSKIQFPQGHGDAWGHYLTALTVYYNLLQNTNFTWLPRASATLIAGVPVQVNYEDEQKFAHAAAAKASTGAEIVKQTYESAYVENPSGQYQGYEDTDTNRAWGLSEWARRAGQGAYFDWVTVNALLPAVDPNPNNTGLSKVDRTTVSEINKIPSTYTVVQNQLDEADAGLNPLGLVKQSVPFDIDPSLIDKGQTHFEQIYSRAVSAMQNAVSVWNQANQFTSALRRQQDTVQQFSQNVQKQDQDFQSRLIEVFGYPYAGDIGQPGSTYPAGYTGPDLYHYMYVDMSSLDAAVSAPAVTIVGNYNPLPGSHTSLFTLDVPNGTPLATETFSVNFPVGNDANRFQPPVSWGSRRAPGEIQNALMTMQQDQIRLQQALANYNALLVQVQNNVELLIAHYNLNTANTIIQNDTAQTVLGLQAGAAIATAVGNATLAAASTVKKVQDVVLEGVPKVVGLATDATAPIRQTIKAVTTAAQVATTAAAVVSLTTASALQVVATVEQNQANTKILANTQGYEMQQQLVQLENQIQQEEPLRLECLNMRETVAQDLGAYQAALAKGLRILDDRCTFAQQAAAQTQTTRYQDMTFRIFQNDAIQKYKAQFALAQKYVYMSAIAYDFETELLGTATGAGEDFLTDIIQQQSLGQMDGSTPVNGVAGLADPLARLGQDFAVLKGQLGFNNPQTETGKFSLRYGLFRQQPTVTNAIAINGAFTNDWQSELKKHIVPDLWKVPEFRRYCRPFAPESAGPQPGLVLTFGTTITYGLNFFGWPLSGGDSAYDPTLFSTKVRSVGVWFAGYDNSGLSTTPRIYLIPVGQDIMRSPTDGLSIRSWSVQDQSIPVPLPLGVSTGASASYIPMNNSLAESMGKIRQFSSFLGYTDQSPVIDPTQVTTNSRLIGRSVWNTRWMLIIPGGTLLNDPNAGLQDFVNTVSDVKIFFQTYSYSGN